MKLNTDRVLSLSAMLVGVGSLFIIVYQTYLLREQQNASALPYLMVSLMANDRQTYIVVRNSGVGPALIEDVRIRQNGREIETTRTIFTSPSAAPIMRQGSASTSSYRAASSRRAKRC